MNEVTVAVEQYEPVIRYVDLLYSGGVVLLELGLHGKGHGVNGYTEEEGGTAVVFLTSGCTLRVRVPEWSGGVVAECSIWGDLAFVTVFPRVLFERRTRVPLWSDL